MNVLELHVNLNAPADVEQSQLTITQACLSQKISLMDITAVTMNKESRFLCMRVLKSESHENTSRSSLTSNFKRKNDDI